MTMESFDCMCDDGREAATAMTLEAELFVCSVVMHMAAYTLQHRTIVANSSLHQSGGCSVMHRCYHCLILAYCYVVHHVCRIVCEYLSHFPNVSTLR